MNDQNIKYVLKAEGCQQIYYRPLTSLAQQDVTAVSTTLILSSQLNDSGRKSINTLNRSNVITTIEKLGTVLGEDIETSLVRVITSPSLAAIFQELTGVHPSRLGDLPPLFINLSGDLVVSENATITYSAALSHWNSQYDAAYEWSFEGSIVSTSTNWQYNTTKNSQGSRTLTLRIGTNDGSGLIDSTKPIKTYQTTIQVNDTYPAIAPTMALVGSSLRNFLSGTVQINTGALTVNCESFSRLALVSGSSNIPTSSQFTISCHQNGLQTESFLISPGDGVKNLYLWAQDSSGNISTTPTIVSLTLDQTPPVLSLAPISASRGGSTSDIIYSKTDASGFSDVKLLFAEDGVSFLTTLDITHLASPYSWTAPSINASVALFKMIATDAAGNTAEVISNVFSIDSTNPIITQTAIISPLTSNLSLVTLGGSCETGLSIAVSGSVISTTNCVGGAWSFSTSQSTDGNYTYVFTQTDAVGNSGSVSATWIRETVPPALTWTSPVAASEFQSTFTAVGNCESGLNIEFGGTGLTSNSTTLCSGGNYAVGLNLSIGDGTKNVVISQTDIAGNTTTLIKNFVRDNVAPIVSWISPANDTEATTQISVTLSCEGNLPVEFSGAGLLAPFSALCSGGSLTRTLFFSAGDGNKAVSLQQTDLAGNSSVLVSRNFVRDTTAPLLTQTLVVSPVVTNAASVTFGGSCESGLTIQISGESNGSVICAANAWSYTATPPSTDNTYIYTFTIADAAGNETTLSTQYVLDTSGPSLTVNGGTSFITASNTHSFSGTCETGRTISISDTDSSTTTCSAGVWSYTTTSQVTDGIRNYSFSQTDVAGNTSITSATWERNTTGPLLTINETGLLLNSSNTVSFTGDCEIGLTVQVTGATTTSFACPGGTWSFDVPSQGSDGLRTYTFTQTNALMISTVVNGQWRRDTSAPTITSFTANSGAASTASRFVNLSLQATDSGANISDFCIQMRSTTPPTSVDPCWVAVNAPSPGILPATSISFSNYQYALDIADDTYDLYVWVRDELGHISTLSNAGVGTASVDKSTIQLIAGRPAVIESLRIANTETPSNPILKIEQTALAGQDIFVHWKVTDNQPLDAGSLQFYFTTNEADDSPSAWSVLSGGLNNSINGACSLVGDDTGCAVLSAPTNNYFRVQLRVKDATQLDTRALAAPMNSSSFSILAGNTEIGIGGSGKSAIFQNDVRGNARFADKQALVVTNDGTIYFRDYSKGILRVSPTDSKVDLFLPTTGTATGDGGPVTNATLVHPQYIALDYSNRLLIFDYNRIRRVDLNVNPPVITTIIGGGVSTADSIVNPLDLHIEPPTISGIGVYNDRNARNRNFLTVAPNNDIYFRSENLYLSYPLPATDRRVRIYKQATGQIQSMTFSGTGTAAAASVDISTCAWNNLGFAFSPTTGAIEGLRLLVSGSYNPGNLTCYQGVGADSTAGDIGTRLNPTTWQSEGPHYSAAIQERTSITTTGMDGRIYVGNRESGRITRFNHDKTTATAGTTTVLAGAGTAGYCEDDTLATSCAITPQSIFVTAQGQVYFTEQGMIRTITSTQHIKTVYGQTLFHGDSGAAVAARFALTQGIDIHTSGGNKVVVYDGMTKRIREFTIGGTIDTIAGNGSYAEANEVVLATNQGLMGNTAHFRDHISTDRISGDVYSLYRGSAIARLNRTSGLWERVFGLGSVDYWSNDNALSTSSRADYPIVLGLSAGKLLVGANEESSTTLGAQAHSMLKLIDTTTLQQTHLAGITQDPISITSYCNDGVLSASCDITTWRFSSTQNATYDAVSGRWLIGASGHNQIVSFGVGQNKFTEETFSNGLVSFAYKSTSDDFFYCSTSGALFKKSSGVETQLPFPNPSFRCQGNSLIYDSARDVLVFPFTQNGLWGVGEYEVP